MSCAQQPDEHRLDTDRQGFRMKLKSFLPRGLAVLALTIALGGLFSACSYVAVEFAPEKKATTVRTDASVAADEHFWRVFHEAKYEAIPPTLELMTAAYLDNPSDSITASHIAWRHIWRLSGRERLDPVPATISDDAVLSRKYFQEAVSLNPAEAHKICLCSLPSVVNR